MTVKPLSYDEKLTLEEANERLEEIQEEFDALKTKYTKGLRRIQFWLPKKDRKRIADCIGVILPLSLQGVVQEELCSAPESEETIHYKTRILQDKMLDMLASYVNTKTKRFGYSKPIWRD